MTMPIPSPQGYPVLGNVLEVDAEHPQESLALLAARYGPIFRLRLPLERLFVANYSVAQELFDEKRFQKSVSGPLGQVRNATRDGLFTAFPGEHMWEVAHRILMPAFGPLSIRSMFGEMQDIVSQMVLKWARFGPDTAIDVSDDFTKLTLDSIALCAMGDRFNSFYHDEPHPFVGAMNGMLTESFARSRRPNFLGSMFRSRDERYRVDIETLENTSRRLLEARRANPTDKKDLLNAMINGKDPKTGEQLDDDTIIRNMITFLIAGHETTSGLLSFLFFELLENPKAMSRAVREVDKIIGQSPVSIDHMSKLPYLEACLRETLRLHPTAPAFTVEAKGDQKICDDKYQIKDGECLNILLTRVHRDPEVYGADVDDFRPSRMEGENFDKLPPNAWKPFGNGSRACIGRPFAWQEALLATATLLQTFYFTKENPSYTLQIRTALTIKPNGFYIKARLRDPSLLEYVAKASGQAADSKSEAAPAHPAVSKDDDANNTSPLLILFGSNTGTCESLAQSLASAAGDNRFRSETKPLDDATGSLQQDTPTVIITSSYEGQPPDNAGHFVEWLEEASKDDVGKVPFAVFGVGNKEWRSTYQKIPTAVDDKLAQAGANRLIERAAVDVARGNIFDEFDEWQEKELWPALKKLSGKPEKSGPNAGLRELKIDLGPGSRSKLLRQDVMPAKVTETRLLTKPGAPRKRHIGIGLPTGVKYRTGDYLAVLPLNPPSTVQRVMRRFKLPWDSTLVIHEAPSTSLPANQVLSVHDVLSGMLELGQQVTAKLAHSLAMTIPDENQSKGLRDRVADANFSKFNTTLLDLLEDYPTATFSFGQFLAAVPPMHLRQYSISSTPLSNPSECSLTYSVLDAPSKGSQQGQRYLGVASTYLERLTVGDHLQVSLRPSRSGFHLPVDDSRPIIMACAGTGLAPFHGFVAERALKKEGGLEVGPALLFYGCNSPQEDDMYRDEFDTWEKAGVVSVRRAYTFAADESSGCKFVQDRIWADRDKVSDSFRGNALVYICGAGIVGSSIEATFAQIRAEAVGSSREAAEIWIQEVKGERYWADVFA